MRRQTVLVVDDDDQARRQCQSALEAARYSVVAVPDAHRAVEAMTGDPRLRGSCDLVVLEHVLPDDNGIHAFWQLRRHVPDLAGLLFTGHSSLHVAVEALNFGFSQVLSKPVESFQLTEAAAAALADRHRRRENARLKALTRLYDALGELAAVHDARQLYDCIVRLAVEETSADSASLMLFDARHQVLHVAAAVGLRPEVAERASCSYGEPISGWVARTGVALELSPQRPVPAAVRAALRRPEVSAAMCLPLRYAERPMGVLNISRLRRDLLFRPGDLELATVLATDAALAIGRLDMLDEHVERERIATVGRLASTIIHDLRGPVTIIRGAAELMEDDFPDHPAPLRVIAAEVESLESMCEQLLSFARDASSVVLERFALADLLDDVAAGAVRACAAAGLTWECVLEVDGQVEAARGEITRAVSQLVEAACHCAPAGSPVSVHGRLAGEQVELRLVGRDDEPQRWRAALDAPAALASERGPQLPLAMARHVLSRHHGAVDIDTGEAAYALTLRWPQRPAA